MNNMAPSNTVERVVKDKAFRYYIEAPHPVDPDGKVLRERLARRGETIQVLPADAEKGDRLGAFVTDADRAAIDAAEQPSAGVNSVASATDEQLVEWLETEKPSVAATIGAAGDDPELAQRLLNAEESVTGRKARSTAVSGLQAIIDAAAESDEDEDDESEEDDESGDDNEDEEEDES